MQPVLGQHWTLSIVGQEGGGRCFIFRNSTGAGGLAEEERQERQALLLFTTTTIAVQISSTGDHRFLILLLPSPANANRVYTAVLRKKPVQITRQDKRVKYILFEVEEGFF
jgi:hypothetical protein